MKGREAKWPHLLYAALELGVGTLFFLSIGKLNDQGMPYILAAGVLQIVAALVMFAIAFKPKKTNPLGGDSEPNIAQ